MRRPLVIAALLTLTATPARAQEFRFGNDLSYVNQMEDCGAVFREGGQPKDVYRIFADHGTNLVRVRLWNNPSWWQSVLVQPPGADKVYSGLQDVRETIRRAKDEGMEVLLDFHYSDFWADPGRQWIPRAWEWAATSTSSMKTLVYQYTRDVLETLDAEGLMPDMVQLGNEITGGLLNRIAPAAGWDGGQFIADNSWARHAQILKEAIRAVREVGAAASVDPRIAMHLAGGVDDYRWQFNNMIQAGVTDFDVMGISAYYAWGHYGDLYELEYYVEDLATAFPDFEVMVLETDYPWTTQNFDSLPNIVTTGDPDYLPISPGKQLEYLTDYTRAVMRGGGTGVVFWEPAWVSTPCRTPWGQGSSHDHLVFFDPYQTNFMEDGGGRWTEPQFYTDLSDVKTTFIVDMTGADVSQGVFVALDVGPDAGQIVPMWPLGGSEYYFYAYLSPGSSGALHFLNGPDAGDRETVPASCAAGGERPFEVPDAGGTLDYVWGACITDTESTDLPDRVVLRPPWPNPFTGATTLSWDQPRAAHVRLEVFDVSGRHMRTLADGWRPAGRNDMPFDAAGLPAGLFVARLAVGTSVETSALFILR